MSLAIGDYSIVDFCDYARIGEGRRADRDGRCAGKEELDRVLWLIDAAHRENRELRRLVRVMNELYGGGMDTAPRKPASHVREHRHALFYVDHHRGDTELSTAHSARA